MIEFISTSKQIEVFFKPTQNSKQKKAQIVKRPVVPIFRFLDPYASYILHGDIILPNTFWHNKDQTVYPLELFLDYKVIRQIHFRKNGIIFELEAFNENELSSIKLLQERLKSLGDKHANDLAGFLEIYNDYFENNNVPMQLNIYGKPLEGKADDESVFDFVDQVFDSNTENVIFMKGNKIINKKDFRAQFLCYNFKLLEWITREKNFFSDKFIRDCFRMGYFADFKKFVDLLRDFCFPTIIQESKGKFLRTSIHTIVGKVSIPVQFYSILLPKKNVYFRYWIHSKENHDPAIVNKLKIVANFDENMSTTLTPEEKNQQEVGAYSHLMRSYYKLRK